MVLFSRLYRDALLTKPKIRQYSPLVHTLEVLKACCYQVIQINHQTDATVFQFIILTFIYSSTCFGRSPAHHQELSDCSSSLWFYLRIVVMAVLCSWSGRPDHEQDTAITTIRR